MCTSMALRREYSYRAPDKALAAPYKSVLVVDDSPVNRNVATILLQNLGFSVAQASDASQAIEHCYHHQVDLIIMDVIMPGISGLECTKIIRKQQRHKHILIVLGWSTAASWQECKDAGMDGMLPKPLDPISLKKILAKFNLAIIRHESF
jgi:CheY-like chemotaxis protein